MVEIRKLLTTKVSYEDAGQGVSLERGLKRTFMYAEGALQLTTQLQRLKGIGMSGLPDNRMPGT